MAETRGIEVFGRGATVVEYGVEAPRRRTGYLGAAAVLLGLAAGVGTVLGILSVEAGDVERARVIAFAAIGCGAGGGLFALAALATRHVASGLVGLALSVVGNPAVLTRLLEWAGSVGA